MVYSISIGRLRFFTGITFGKFLCNIEYYPDII